MVGRPAFETNGHGSRRPGSALHTPGLDELDEAREASMADEGGRSAMTVERQPTIARPVAYRRRLPRWLGLVLMVTGVTVAVLLARRFRR